MTKMPVRNFHVCARDVLFPTVGGKLLLIKEAFLVSEVDATKIAGDAVLARTPAADRCMLQSCSGAAARLVGASPPRATESSFRHPRASRLHPKADLCK